MKKLICGALALTLLVTPALGAGSFPAVNTYAGFEDVSQDAWYASAVKQCYETGLMNGTGKGNFSPQGTMTVAECAAIAARIRATVTGQLIMMPVTTSVWYTPYVDYMQNSDLSLAPILAQPEAPTSRMEFLLLLSAALPDREELLPAINSITALPDSDDETVLAFYNAGILTGVDKYGTFNAAGTLTRAEVAAMVARITDPALRQSFIPQEKPGQTVSQPSTSAGDALVTVNGRPISRDTFLALVCNIAYDLDYYIYVNTGGRLDLSVSESDRDYILSYAKDMVVYRGLLEILAEELGCADTEVPARLAPSPTIEELRTYARNYDILCAKHILCPDSQTAQAVLDGLEATPTLEQFNALLQVFGTDPGMVQNPDGYLFTTGDMISEFEVGVRGLETNTYTTEPVQSQFGYHIIWRMDPATHPDLVEEYRQAVLDELLIQQAQTAQVVMDEAAIDAIDLPAVYNAFLAQLPDE